MNEDDPIRVEVHGGILEFPANTTQAQIDQTITELFPPTDEEVHSMLSLNPMRPATMDEFRAFERHEKNNPTPFLSGVWEGFKHMGSEVLQGVKALPDVVTGDTIPQKLAIGLEALLRGTGDIGLIAQKGWNNIKEFAGQSEQEQLEAFNYLRNLEGSRQKTIEGEGYLTDLINVGKYYLSGGEDTEPTKEVLSEAGLEVVEPVSYVTDPSAAIPGLGVMSKFSKPIVAAPMKAAGKTVAGAASLAQRGINAASGVVEGAARAFNPEIKAGTVSGSLIPATAQAGLEAARAVGQVAVEVAEEFVNPRRVPAFSRITQQGSGVTRGVAAAARPFTPVVDVTMHAASGSLEGAAIGGVLGYISDGREGAAQGIGGGMLLGLGGGIVSHAIESASGAKYATGVMNEWNAIHKSLFDDPKAANRFADRMDPYQRGLLLDMTTHVTKTGNKVILVDNNGKLPNGVKADAFKGAYSDKDGNIYLNIDQADVTTAPHEFVHFALKKTVAANKIAGVRNLVFGFDFNGNRLVQPIMGDEMVVEFSRQYAERLRQKGLENDAKAFEQWTRDSFDKTKSDIERLEAQNKVAEEMFAFMAGDEFAKNYRNQLNPDATTGFLSWLGNHMAMWRDAHKDAYNLRFEKGLEGAFTQVNKDARVQKVFRDVFSDLKVGDRDPSKTRINLKKMTKSEQKKFLDNTPAAKDYFNDDGTGKPAGEVLAKEQADASRAYDGLRDQGVEVLEPDNTTTVLLDNIADADKLNDAIGQYAPSTQGFIKAVVDGLKRAAQPTYIMSYFKASGKRKPGSRKPYDQFEMSHREVLPYRIAVNKTGGMYFKGVNMTKVRQRMKSQKRHFGKLFNDDAEMMKYFHRYLSNLTSDNRLPSVDVMGGGDLGARRRNFFHEVVGTVPTKNSGYANLPREGYVPQNEGVFQDFRVERVTALTPTQTAYPFTGETYRHSQVNYQPSRDARRSAMRYARDNKIRYQPADAPKDVPAPLAKRLASVHEQAKHEPRHPKVKESYDALKRDLKKQFGYLNKEGEVRFQPPDREYMSAVESGDMKSAQRMVDEAAKKAGYSFGPAYHGTKSPDGKIPFNKFELRIGDLSSQGNDVEAIFFTEYKNLADSIALYASNFGRGSKPYTFNAYVKLDNPYTGQRAGMTRDQLMEMGYDGVATISDSGRIVEVGVFDPSSVKSADPVVIDDTGNVVPLSKRFDSTKDDIRYQPMSGEAKAAAEANGYTYGPVYHGTWTGDNEKPFYKFNPKKRGWSKTPLNQLGVFFSKERDYAEAYTTYAGGSKMGGEPRVVEAMLKLENPYHMDYAEFMSYMDYGSKDSQKYKTATEANKAVKSLKDRLIADGHDGVIIDGGGEVAVFDTKRIKDASDKTFDNKGKEVPLSKRFDSTKDDIRYQPSTKHLMDNPNFRAWFEGAELKDSNGNPKLLYHGTKQDITRFNGGTRFDDGLIFFTEDAGFASDWALSASRQRRVERDAARAARFDEIDKAQREYDKTFDESRENDIDYVDSWFKKAPRKEQYWIEKYEDANIVPVVINAKKVFDPRKDINDLAGIIDKSDIDHARETGGWAYFESPKVVSRLRELGYDAMRISENSWGKDFSTIAIWDNRLAKSALSNTKFDPTSSDIRYQPAGEDLSSYLQERSIPEDHPLAAKSGLKLGDRELTYDNLLSITHNYFGRGQHGHLVGVDAYLDHATLVSDKAKGALAAETLTLGEWEKATPLNAERKAYVAPRQMLDRVAKLQPDKAAVESGGKQIGDGLYASEAFTIDDGFATRFMPAEGVNLKDFVGRKAFALTADRMGTGVLHVGPPGAKRPLRHEGKGGIGFLEIFGEGGWAFSDKKSADNFMKRVRAVADGDDSVLVALTTLAPDNHLKNLHGRMAIHEAFTAAIDHGALSRADVDATISEVAKRLAESKDKNHGPKRREVFSKIHDLDSYLEAISKPNYSFDRAGDFRDGLMAKKLPLKQDELKAAGVDIETIAFDTSDRRLEGIPDHHAVALVEIPVNQTARESDFHLSYPHVIDGKFKGLLRETFHIQDLTTNDKIVVKRTGKVGAQPMQTVLPHLDLLHQGKVNFQPSDVISSQFKLKGEEVILNKFPDRVAGDHALNILKKSGVKAEEILWTGLEDYLNSKPMHNKADVLAEIRKKMPVVREQVYGAGAPKISKAEAVRLAENDAENIFMPDYSTIDEDGTYYVWKDGSGTVEGPFHDEHAAIEIADALNDQQRSDLINDIANQYLKDNARETTYDRWSSAARDSTIPYRERLYYVDNVEGFDSGHFDETLRTVGPDAGEGANQNLLMHMRETDQTIDGRNALVIEELQSDWHQEGRQRGYRNEETIAEKRAQRAEIDKEAESLESAREAKTKLLYKEMAIDKNSQKVAMLDEAVDQLGQKITRLRRMSAQISDEIRLLTPNAPFKTTWPEFMFKKAVMDAVASGKEMVAWVDGGKQADRYSLGNAVDNIAYDHSTQNLLAVKGDKTVFDQTVPPKDIASYVGKELAKKLIEDVGPNGISEASGNDLKIGASGMRTFYDQMLPKIAAKIGKKWGAVPQHRPDLGMWTMDLELAKEHVEGFTMFQPVAPFGEPTVTPQGRIWSNGDATVLQKGNGKLRLLDRDGRLLGIAKDFKEVARMLHKAKDKRNWD